MSVCFCCCHRVGWLHGVTGTANEFVGPIRFPTQLLIKRLASIETIKQRVIISRSAETQTEAEAVDWTRATDAASDLSGFCCCELLLTGVRAPRPTAVLINPDFSVDPR